MKPVSTTRRDFLKKSALGAGVKSASATKVVRHKAPTLAPELGASDRIVAGFIGVGGQGYNSHPIRGGGARWRCRGRRSRPAIGTPTPTPHGGMMHQLRQQSSMSIVRTFLFAASVLAAAALLPPAAQAQTPPDLPDPSNTLYEVRLGDGSVIIARIAELDGASVVLVTAGGARLEIDRSHIRKLRPVRGRVSNGNFWSEDPGASRLFFTATGRSLSQGESYIGTYLVILPFAAVGLTDRITIAVGAPVLLGEIEPFYIAPKVQVLRLPNVQASLGTLAFFFNNETHGIVYGVGTFGDADKALSAGLGFFYSGSGFADDNEPAFMLGGEARVSRRIKLITENYVIPHGVGVLLSGGIRVIGDRFNTEVGVGVRGIEGETECCLPLINFSYSFGR